MWDVHFHDLRHKSNDLEAKARVAAKELMFRIRHAAMSAALIYQHASSECDQEIADKISRNVT